MKAGLSLLYLLAGVMSLLFIGQKRLSALNIICFDIAANKLRPSLQKSYSYDLYSKLFLDKEREA